MLKDCKITSESDVEHLKSKMEELEKHYGSVDFDNIDEKDLSAADQLKLIELAGSMAIEMQRLSKEAEAIGIDLNSDL